MIETVSTNIVAIIKVIANVVISALELIKSLSDVAALIMANIASATKAVVEAVSALAVVLSAVLNVVFQVVATAAEYLKKLSSEVLQVLSTTISALTIVVKSVTAIVAGINQSLACQTGAASGFCCHSIVVYVNFKVFEF